MTIINRYTCICYIKFESSIKNIFFNNIVVPQKIFYIEYKICCFFHYSRKYSTFNVWQYYISSYINYSFCIKKSKIILKVIERFSQFFHILHKTHPIFNKIIHIVNRHEFLEAKSK